MNYRKLNLHPNGADPEFEAPTIDDTLEHYSLSLEIARGLPDGTDANYFEAVRTATDALANMFHQTAEPEYANSDIYRQLGTHAVHILVSETLSTLRIEHLVFRHEDKSGLMLTEQAVDSTGLRIVSYPASPNHNRQLIDILPKADIPEIVSKTNEFRLITINVGATGDEEAMWQPPETEHCERVAEISLYEAFCGRNVLQLIGNGHEEPGLHDIWPAGPYADRQQLLSVISV
jgi:hypothetical protein